MQLLGLQDNPKEVGNLQVILLCKETPHTFSVGGKQSSIQLPERLENWACMHAAATTILDCCSSENQNKGQDLQIPLPTRFTGRAGVSLKLHDTCNAQFTAWCLVVLMIELAQPGSLPPPTHFTENLLETEIGFSRPVSTSA